MTHWLKLIGCSKNPITEAPFYGEYDELSHWLSQEE
jgi:hypothetical protein